MNAYADRRRATLLAPWWRLALVAASTLILCSCRGPLPTHRAGNLHSTPGDHRLAMVPGPAAGGAALPPEMMPADRGYYAPPLPSETIEPWAPPGIARPWPRDEYLRDGGDHGLSARVNPDWLVFGLDVEDTVVHYDTLDGRTVVEPSNPVHIYAPRFGAVRHVAAVVEDDQIHQPYGVEAPNLAVNIDTLQVPVGSLQREQLVTDIASRNAAAYWTRQQDGAVSRAVLPYEFQDKLLPFEDLAIIRYGAFEQTDNARLATGVEAAIVWTGDRAVQIVLDRRQANETVTDQKAGSVFVVDDSRGPAKLRVVKIASKLEALPGDSIDFTIRFDNVGDQTIGNVTVLDNLSPRLEYVEGSQQASLPAEFFTEQNEVGSVVLRWELTDALERGAGGVVRFQCRVR